METDPGIIRKFAEAITPPNWNFFLSPGEIEYAPNTLNIGLEILDGEEAEARHKRARKPFAGRIGAPMFFNPLSSLARTVPQAAAQLERLGDGLVAEVQIQLCPHFGAWRETLVHELAHVAATRWKARRYKAAGARLEFMDHNVEEEEHGPIFLKAFRRVIVRTRSAFGREVNVKAMWWSYCDYADQLGRAGEFSENSLLALAPKRVLIEWSMARVIREHRMQNKNFPS